MNDLFYHIELEDAKHVSADQLRAEQAARVQRIVAGQTEKARAFVLDPASYVSVRCPRRSGKSYGMAAKAVYTGETKPGSRILIISLTLKSTKENFWSGSPSGIFRMDREYNLGLQYNHTDCVWWHQNGSRGRLAGAETRADIEYLRGAAAEADIVLIDECKSFAPALMYELLTDALEPGLMTRNGQLVMGGTPGLLPYGPFYEATEPTYRGPEGDATCIPHELFETVTPPVAQVIADDEDEAAPDEPWSLHSWTVQDNTACPGQWKRALRIKRRRRWDNDHPTWRREYLGEWAGGAEGFVYAYAAKRESGKVTWFPAVTRDNPTGLPPEDGPWHLVLGLDFGFEDDTAFVLAAYSERMAELRHVYDYKGRHMLPDDVARHLEGLIAKYGQPEYIVGDAGALGGKVYVETLAMRHGIFVEKAEKSQKMDHIEFVNSDFHAGRIKIIPDTDMERELLGLLWDLQKDPGLVKDEEGNSDPKRGLARLGKLKEDPGCPNHLCDALLYLHRFAYHFFAQPAAVEPKEGSPAWLKARARQAEMRVARKRDSRGYNTDSFAQGPRPMGRDDLLMRKALGTWRN